MKYFLIIFVVLTNLLFSANINFTQEEKEFIKSKESIKVHTESSWYPFSFIENNKPDGYINDLKLLFSKKTGLKLEIIPKSYDEAINSLLNNEIDIMFDIGKNEKYKDKLIFNDYHTVFYYEGIISPRNYKNLNELTNKTVGYISGLDHYSKDFPNTKFVPFNDDKTMINALLNKKIDAAVDSYITLKYFKSSMNIIDDVLKLNLLKSDISDASQYYHIATQKENQILMDIINKTIKKDDILELQEKWDFIKKSEIKYQENELTHDEEIYLKNKKILKTRVEENWIPYSFEEDEIPKGYFHDILRTFAKKSGLQLQTTTLDYENSIKALNNKQIDIFLDADQGNMKGLPVVIGDKPIYLYSEVIFSKDGYKNLETLNNKKVGYISGMEYIFESKNDLEFISYESEQDLILDILNDNIDLAVAELHSVKYYLNNTPGGSLIKIYPRFINEEFKHGFPAVHKDNEMLLSIFNKLIKKNDIEFLKSKWGINVKINSRDEITNLTFEEDEYLHNKNNFNVCARFNHYPLSGYKNGQLTGISGDIFNIIKKDLNIKLNIIESKSNEEFVKNVTSNKCDIIPIIKQDSESFKNIKTIPSAMIHQQFVAIGNALVPYLEELEEDKNAIFYVKGTVHEKVVKNMNLNLNVILETDVNKIFDNIKRNKNSYLILPSILADHLIQKYGADEYKIIDRFERIKAVSTIGVNINTVPMMLDILDKSIIKIGPSTLDEIVSNYKIKEYNIIQGFTQEFIIAVFLLIIIIIFVYSKNLQIKQEKEKFQKSQKMLSQYVLYSKTDLKGIITEASDAFCDLSGYSKEELIGNPHSIVRHPDMPKSVFKDIWQTIKKDDTWKGEIKNKTKNGGYYWVEALISPEYDEWNRLIGYISIRHDITGKKNFQEQQLLMLEQSKMASLGEMIGNIAHQWRQPLSAISSSTSALVLKQAVGALDEKELQTFCDATLKNTQYLSDTINTFRDFIKDEKVVKEVILQDEIKKGLQIISSSLKDYHINLIDEIDHESPIETLLVAGELQQVVINILNNAKDILTTKPEDERWIKVNLTNDDNKAILTIEDNGGGIPENIINKIFEPYFTTKHQSQGTGLGLYMSYKIISESLKGELTVSNTKNGAEFKIVLPLNL